jgi:hypothetical protein
MTASFFAEVTPLVVLYEPAAPWAERTFAPVDLGDPRRYRRLVQTAARIADRPQGSLPSKFDWNGLRAVYRLMNRPEATHESLIGPHCRQVRAAMARAPVVLIVHDTTQLDFTSHRALRGTGPLGTGGGRGFLQHNSLAVLPEGRLLGLAYQQVVLRQPAPPRETQARRAKRRRESPLWADGIAGVGPAPEGCPRIDVADCGGDVFDALHRARGLGHHFLIRAAQDRKVRVGPPGAAQGLPAPPRAGPGAGGDWGGGDRLQGRPPRRPAVALAAAEVRISPPWPESRQAARLPRRARVQRISEP